MGIRVLLNELHVILECPGSEYARRATGIYAFLEALLPVMTEHAIMKEFLGGGQGRHCYNDDKRGLDLDSP